MDSIGDCPTIVGKHDCGDVPEHACIWLFGNGTNTLTVSLCSKDAFASASTDVAFCPWCGEAL